MPQYASVATKRTAWLYIFQCVTAFKVGITRGDSVTQRLKSVQAGCPIEVKLLRAYEVPAWSVRWAEARAHEELKLHRTYGEWFLCERATVLACVRKFAHEARRRPEFEVRDAPFRRNA